MRDPRTVSFPLLEFGLPGKCPREIRFAHPRHRQRLGLPQRLRDPRLEVAPRLAAARPQAFRLRIGQICLGRGGLRNGHVEVRGALRRGAVRRTSYSYRVQLRAQGGESSLSRNQTKGEASARETLNPSSDTVGTQYVRDQTEQWVTV